MNYTEVLKQYLEGDALNFASSFVQYCHMIDDVMDEPQGKTPEFLLMTFEMAATLYANPFYREHAGYLLPLIKAATNAYADSVYCETSEEEWCKHFKAPLASQANDVILAVIEIVKGQQVRRHASKAFRQIAFETHKDSFYA